MTMVAVENSVTYVVICKILHERGVAMEELRPRSVGLVREVTTMALVGDSRCQGRTIWVPHQGQSPMLCVCTVS